MLKDLRKNIDKLREKKHLINAYVNKYYDQSAEKDYLDFFLRLTCKLVNGERGSIFIVDMENETVWLETGTGMERKQINVPRDGSMVGRVISSGKAEICNDMVAQEGIHKKVDSSTGFSTRNAICVPVKNLEKTRITGAIQVLNKKNGETFDGSDQKWLEDIAENLQLNIEHVYLQQETLGLMNTAIRFSSQLSKLVTIILTIIIVSMMGFIASSVILYNVISD